MGKYNVNQQLYALGKYMTAYDAVQEGLGKKVEIRVLAQRAQEGSMELSRFQSEIKNLAQLDHPAILRVLDCGVANGKLYYVVELKKRVTVQELCAQQPPPPLEEKLKIAVQIASALKYMHGKGIIHRGLDDASVNYDPEVGQAYISQFTFVKNVRTDNLTSRGIGNVFQLLTTPEGAMGQALDARSDVFLLGVLAFKLISGAEPYSSKAFLGLTSETAANVQQKKLREVDASLPEPIEVALAKATAVLPQNRYQTAQEFHDALVDATKKLKLPKWADRKEPSQPAAAELAAIPAETDAQKGPPSASVPKGAASRVDVQKTKLGMKRPGQPSSSKTDAPASQEAAPPAENAAAAGPATVGAKIDAFLARLKTSRKTQAMVAAAVIGAIAAFVGLVALVLR